MRPLHSASAATGGSPSDLRPAAAGKPDKAAAAAAERRVEQLNTALVDWVLDQPTRSISSARLLMNSVMEKARAEVAGGRFGGEWVFETPCDGPAPALPPELKVRIIAVPPPAEDRRTGFTVTGNARLPVRGVLLHIKQRHAVGTFKVSAEEQGEIVRSQRLVLQTLLDERPTTVFQEGLTGVYGPGEFSAKGRNDMREAFGLFKAGQQLSPRQSDFLLRHGPALIYALLSPNVELRGTATQEQDEQAQRFLSDNRARLQESGLAAQDMSFAFAQREQFAVSLISRWREQKPGAKAALIFGRGHDFIPYESQLDSEVITIDTVQPPT